MAFVMIIYYDALAYNIRRIKCSNLLSDIGTSWISCDFLMQEAVLLDFLSGLIEVLKTFLKK